MKPSEQKQEQEQQASNDAKNSLPALSGGDLGKIQALLYGDQLKAVVDKIDNMNSRYDDRLDDFEKHINNTLDNIVKQQEGDNTNILDDINLLSNKSAEQNERLIEGQEQMKKELKEDLRQAIDELKSKKLDRASLASILGTVVAKIDTDES